MEQPNDERKNVVFFLIYNELGELTKKQCTFDKFNLMVLDHQSNEKRRETQRNKPKKLAKLDEF